MLVTRPQFSRVVGHRPTTHEQGRIQDLWRGGVVIFGMLWCNLAACSQQGEGAGGGCAPSAHSAEASANIH